MRINGNVVSINRQEQGSYSQAMAMMEALLVSSRSCTISQIARVLQCSEEEIREEAQNLQQRYYYESRGIRVDINGDKVQLVPVPEYSR